MLESSRGRVKPGRFLMLVCLFASAFVRAETIHLVADNWCPYNCEPGSERPGFMVEIARRAFAEEGIAVQYSTQPWLRALEDTREGLYDGTIGASKAEAPDFIFPRIEQGQMRNGFWTLADSPWQFQGMHSLALVRLGAIGGYGYGPALEQYLHDDSNRERITMVHGDEPLNIGLNMLLRERIDSLVEDETVMRQRLAREGVQKQVRLAGYVPTTQRFSNIYIAFSPANKRSAHYSQILAQKMQQMRSSGELAKILARYHVADWRD